ncbi:MAG: DUF3795 domain-containing protein [Sedimentibacter sp.]
MKKLFKIIITLLISSFSLAFANSGPTYWQGYPSSDIMTVDKNSPIEVKSEDLTFDFSHEANHSYSVRANVIAEYEMVNPTNETHFVQMARCSLQHGGIEFCYLCDEYPCEKYAGIDVYDSFIVHRNQLKDFEKVKKIEIDSYQSELAEKIEILKFTNIWAIYDKGHELVTY